MEYEEHVQLVCPPVLLARLTPQPFQLGTLGLSDALQRHAFCTLQISPGARRYYDKQRARDLDYDPALLQLGNRLVGLLCGCLKPRTLCNEATAWSQPRNLPVAA
ncbi:hypothetical protein ACH489_30200 [Streptomyces rubiginosohelvolus]|uniref:hypothetical protein n=1 Tax=Streptomyces rubiginosohelvolus TaxID=67362 RepID=UPI00378807B8